MKRVIRNAATLILFILFLGGSAQEQLMEQSEAENYFTNKRFGAVAAYYREVLKKDPSNPDLNFKMGVCYLNSRSQKDKAFEYFKKAMSGTSESTDTEITFKLLADACYLASNYDEAIANYEKHLKALRAKKAPKVETDDILQKIQMCRMGIEIKQLKDSVITLNKQLAGSIKKDSCSANGCSAPLDALTVGGTKKESATNTILVNTSTNESNLLVTKTNLDTSTVMKEATVGASADGQIVLIYREENEEGNLYVSALNGNEWTITERLNKTINNKEWESHEFISADGTELYFSCAREGGFGGKDIYKSVKLPNGEWSEAQNLGPEINSPFDEVAPCIHPNLGTLFFSSNRFKAKGGYDIFTSSFSDSANAWKAATMVGYPIHKKKERPEGEKKADEKKRERESYLVTFLDLKKAPLTMVKGKVIDAEGKVPSYVEITVTNNETGEILGVYSANSKTGHYAFILPPGKNNNITFEADGYLYHTENIDITKKADEYKETKVIQLLPLVIGSKDVLSNLFFDEKKADLTGNSQVELDRLYNFLSEKGTLQVEISANVNADTKLAESKLQTISNYLISKGIDKERVTTKVYKKSKRAKKNENGSANDTLEIKILNI